MPIRDIENHLERCDARIERFERLETLRERNRLISLVIRLNVALFAILCAAFAIWKQF